LKAIAVATGYTNSAAKSGTYTINATTVATPIFSPVAGTYTGTQNVTISCATSGATIYYTTNGGNPTTNSTKYTGAIAVSSTNTLKALAVKSGLTNSAVATATYTINTPTAATPTFSPVAGTYTGTQSVTISDTTSGATIYYTTDSSTPTASSTLYAGAISVASSKTIKAIAIATGYTNSAVASAAYVINIPTVATPNFSPVAGTYTGTQSVTISCATSGATIYYTTNGGNPTTSSTKYTGAISVTSTKTVKAIAVLSGYANSAIASATYTINAPTAATPTFSPVAGTYTSAQSVTISDTTSGAKIYYTTDGSTPSATSTLYSGAISVAATTTIKAIAIASGYTNSAVASAAYTINIPVATTPTFSPAAGTYTSTQSVTISTTTTGASVYYTTDGSNPTTSSTKYTAAISVSSSQTLNAIAVLSGYTNSAVASAAYVINTPSVSNIILNPSFETENGSAPANWTADQEGTNNTTFTYQTSGHTGSRSTKVQITSYTDGFSDYFFAPQNVTAGANYKFSFWYQSDVTTEVDATITTTSGSSTPMYVGTVPASSAWSQYTTTVTMPSDAAKATVYDYIYSAGYLVTDDYDLSLMAATPTFSLASGTYANAQSVTISDTTSGATIYYTTDGSTPTASSTKYTGAIAVSVTTIIKAIAIASGYADSAVGSATYTIGTGSHLNESLDDGWVGDHGTVTHDSSVKHDGTASLKIVTTTDGLACEASKTVGLHSLGTDNFSIFVRSDDWADVAAAQILLSEDSSMTNFFYLNFLDYALDLTNNEWYEMTFTRSEFGSVGNPDWNNISDIILRGWSSNGKTPTIYFDTLKSFSQGTKGHVSVVFDDGWDTQYSQAFTYMQTKGIRGNIFVIPTLIGQSGRVTQANLDAMAAANWDISGHGEFRLTTMSEADLRSDVTTTKAYLDGKGYKGRNIFAYPEGQNNDLVRSVIGQSYGYARTINAFNQPLGYISPYRINAFSSIDTTSVDYTKKYIDDAIANDEWAILVYHKIVASPTIETEYSIANFKAVIDYIVASGVDYSPMSEVLANSAN
jgi:peptidoglycan/xylan/chitin deacetylase (PgdA/CDA1 family)